MLIEYNNKENLQFVIIAGAVNLISMLYFVCGLFAFVKWTMLNTKLLISIRRPITNTRLCNRPRSIYQYSNMAPRLSGQTSIFGVVFFVSKSLLGIERQKKLKKFAILTRKPRSHARILIYRTWPIEAPNRVCPAK